MKHTAATIGLTFLVVIGVLSILSMLLVPGPTIQPGDTDYMIGYLLGKALFPLLGLAAFVRLVTRERKDASSGGPRYVTVGPSPVSPGSAAPAASHPRGAAQDR